MTNVQKQQMSHHVSDQAAIIVAGRQMQFFVVCIAILSSLDLLVYHLSVSALTHPLISMVVLFIAVLGAGYWIIQKLTTTPSASKAFLNHCNQLLNLTIGIALGCGAYMIMRFMPSSILNVDHFHLFFCIILPLSIVYVFALALLSYRPRYFLFVFIPAALPFILFNYLSSDTIPVYFNAIVTIWLLFIITAAIISFNYHRKITQLNDKNLLLKHQNDTQSEHTQSLKQQIKQQHSELKEAQHHLARHHHDLHFTRENASINTWTWNIDKHTLEILDPHLHLDIEYTGDKAHFIIHPEDRIQYRKKMRQYLYGNSDRFDLQYRVKKNDQWFWIHDVGKITARDPVNHTPKQMMGIFRDINDEKRAHEQLQLAANLFDQVTEGLFVLDEELRYINVNNGYEKLTGLKRHQLLGKHIFEVTFKQDELVKKQHQDILNQLAIFGEYRTELQEQYLSGVKLNVGIQINILNSQDDQVIHYVGNVTDLTEKCLQQQRLSYLEQYDPLTDLPNRFYFHYRLNKIIDQGNLAKFAILRINIDRFRLFSDLYLNSAGDELLKKFAARLSQYCSHAQLVAYLNNDDFVVALKVSEHSPNIDDLAEAILTKFQAPFYIAGQEKFISISVGIALYPEQGEQVDVLIRKADAALLTAKQLGGNTYHVFNEQAYEHLSDKIVLKGALQQALKKQQLEVYYQPQICSHSLKVKGFEALIRWHHPEYGIISPGIFIPLAEETSLITEIGQFVIFESCKQLRAWRELGFQDISVSVNIVAQQILRGQLLLDLDTAMTMYQITGEQLELELTESSLLENSHHVLDFLSKIKARNISISLDDFGMGYSSLAYLSQFPIDKLKIDKAFISRIGDQKEEAIVNAIIAMGKAMGMQLIAEGVETTDHLEYLQQHGCDVLQGFYFSKALTALETTAYLRQYKHSLVSHSLRQ